MKHYVKPECKFGCRFLQITPSLWLCPHASYGEASYLSGAVEEARRLMDRAGGYEKLLADTVHAEEAAKDRRREQWRERQQNPSAAEQVRYG